MKFIKNNMTVILSLIILLFIGSQVTTTFLGSKNIINIMGQLSTNMLLTYSLTLVIISGGIDLSVGPMVASSGIILLIALNNGIPFIFSLLLVIFYGISMGAMNGLIITKFNLAPFIVTLSTSFIIRGIGLVITDGTTLTVGNDFLYKIGQEKLFDIFPYSFIVVMIATIFMFLLLNYTKLGTHIYAIGGNEKASKQSGINVSKIKTITYIISAIFACIAGVLLTARMYSASPRIGTGYEVDAIAAAVLGGVSFSGGVGTVGGAFLGGIFMAILNNALNSMQVNESMQLVLKGLILVVAVIIDMISAKRKRHQKLVSNIV